MFYIFIKGFLIGLAIAAPVGPIGVLCIHRSLQDGFKIGFMSGLGAALADGVYGSIAGFGLTALSTFLMHYKSLIQLMGGIFLTYLGVKIMLSHIASQTLKEKKETSSFHAISTTFLLTLSNPATILSFIAIFAGLGIGSLHTTYKSSIVLVLGVILGSAFWWMTLSSVVAIFLKHKLNSITLKWIKILSGSIILLFGIACMFYSQFVHVIVDYNLN